jgi:hypothetical protein
MGTTKYAVLVAMSIVGIGVHAQREEELYDFNGIKYKVSNWSKTNGCTF